VLRLLGRGETLTQAVKELVWFEDALAWRLSELAAMWLNLVNQHMASLEEHEMIPPEAIKAVEDLVRQQHAQIRLESRLEGKLEGKLEGERIGEARGEARGELKAKRDAVVLVLSTRFTLDKASLGARLDTVTDVARLDELLELATTATSWADVEVALP